MAGESLFQLVSQALSQKNKSAIGYTVKGYQGVLADLQQDLYGGGAGGGKNDVFGVRRLDYTGVENMDFDENGFSKKDKAIRKMKITTTGACPVKYQQAYDIAYYPHESPSNAQGNPFGNAAEMCPCFLTQDTAQSITVDNFKLGAAIDLHNLGLKYFKNYSNTNVTFEEHMLTKLLTNKCLRAQVIFPRKNKSLLVDVIQHTPFTNMACIYLSTPIASSGQWKDSGVTVNIKANNKTEAFIPNGTVYTSAVNGKSYYVGKGTMDGMSKKDYKNWVENSAEKYIHPKHTLQLQKPAPIECYVKLFIPEEKKSIAQEFLPDKINPSIFQQYQNYINDTSGSGSASQNIYQGQLSAILQGLARAWSGVATNSGAGSISYSLGAKTLVRGNHGSLYSSTTGSVTPIFSTTSGKLILDCSSLACFLMFNSGVIRDDIQTVSCYPTSNLLNFPDYLNKLLKPGYKAVLLDNTDPKQIKTGDLLFCNNKEKGQYKGTFEKYGHAAWAYVTDNKVYTLQIGSTNKGKLLKNPPRNEIPKNGKYYYRRIIRIIKV